MSFLLCFSLFSFFYFSYYYSTLPFVLQFPYTMIHWNHHLIFPATLLHHLPLTILLITLLLPVTLINSLSLPFLCRPAPTLPCTNPPTRPKHVKALVSDLTVP